MGFFDVIRQSIAMDQLSLLLDYMRRQNMPNDVNYCIEPNTKVVGKAAMGKGFITAAN